MVSTRPSNATKKVAQVILDTKQKRRTPAQVRADNARIQREKDEQEEKAQKSIEQVAAAQDKVANQQNSTMSSKKPRPRPAGRQVVAANTPSDVGASKSSVVQALGTGGGRSGGQGQEEVGAPNETLSADGDGLEGMQGKRKRTQKTAHRDAVDTARAVLQVTSQSAVDVIKSSHDTEKGKTSKYVP